MQDLTPFLLAIGNLSSSSSDSLGLVSMLPKSASFRTKFNSILAQDVFVDLYLLKDFYFFLE